MTKRILLIAFAALALVASGCDKKHAGEKNTPCSDTMEPLGAAKTVSGQSGKTSSGNIADTGWQYYIWYQAGNNVLKYYDNGLFSVSWNGTNNLLAGVGYYYGDNTDVYPSEKQHDAYFKHTKIGTGGSYSYIGIHGWTLDPLVEFYIVEDWYTKPGVNLLGLKKGEFTIDNGTYEIWQNTRVNMPSVVGTATFPQYFSVRSTPRQCGHINISEHFSNFEKLGMHLGKLYEVMYLVEVGGGTGSVECKYFHMSDGQS